MFSLGAATSSVCLLHCSCAYTFLAFTCFAFGCQFCRIKCQKPLWALELSSLTFGVWEIWGVWRSCPKLRFEGLRAERVMAT